MSGPLRFAILGTANIATDVANAIKSAGHIVDAIASRDLERNVRKFFGSYEEALKDPEISAVYIPLPTTVAEFWAKKAVAEKKHILVDKPFASYESVKSIVEECERHGVVFLDGTHFVHSPRLEEMERQIKQGVIGNVQKVAVATTVLLPDKTDIRYNLALEPTGCLGDIGWYSIRFILSFIGYETRISFVFANGTRTSGGGLENCSGIIQFATGQTAHFDCGFTCGFRQWGECVGDRGTITVDDFVVPYTCGGSLFPKDPKKYNPDLKFKIRKLAIETENGLEMIDPIVQEIEVSGNNKAQSAAMIDTFVGLVRKSPGASQARWVQQTLRTQQVIDGCMNPFRRIK
eukprot:jgi/Galph1/5982/GphlegSOOS_G4596.1